MKRKNILNILSIGLLSTGIFTMAGCDLSENENPISKEAVSQSQANGNTYPSATPIGEDNNNNKESSDQEIYDEMISSLQKELEQEWKQEKVKDELATSTVTPTVTPTTTSTQTTDRQKELLDRKKENDKKAEELLAYLQTKGGLITSTTTPSIEKSDSSIKNTWERQIDLSNSSPSPLSEEVIKGLEERASSPYEIQYELENVEKENIVSLSYLNLPKEGEEGYIPTYYNDCFRKDIEKAIIDGVNELRVSKGLPLLKENDTALKMVRYTSNAQMQIDNCCMVSKPKSPIPDRNTIKKICNMPKYFGGTTMTLITAKSSTPISIEEIVGKIINDETYIKELCSKDDADISVGVAVFEDFEKDDDYRAIRVQRYYVINIFVGNLNPIVNGKEINKIP